MIFFDAVFESRPVLIRSIVLLLPASLKPLIRLLNQRLGQGFVLLVAISISLSLAISACTSNAGSTSATGQGQGNIIRVGYQKYGTLSIVRA